jgi:hypothetical protein
MVCDSARATTITEAKVIPNGYDVDAFHRVLIESRGCVGGIIAFTGACAHENRPRRLRAR